jgi:hypothetical protein
MGELSREAPTPGCGTTSGLGGREGSLRTPCSSGYNTATTAALKPYTVLEPVMAGFSGSIPNYYNDPQDTVASGGK